MNTLIKQAVYLPTDLDNSHYAAITFDRFCEDYLTKKEGFFFTPKQLNELLSNLIKDALNTAAETAKIEQKGYFEATSEECINGIDVYDDDGSDRPSYIVFLDKESITSTFEQIFQKYKV